MPRFYYRAKKGPVEIIEGVIEAAHKDEAVEKINRLGCLPVLVEEEEVDEFYSKHKYDLIFLSGVYRELDDLVRYLKKMRNFLAEDGRLVILANESVCYRFF